MDLIRGLIVLCIFCLLALPSWASIASRKFSYQGSNPTVFFSTVQAACVAWRDTQIYPANPIDNYASHSGGTFSVDLLTDEFGEAGGTCHVLGALCTRNGESCGTDSYHQQVFKYDVPANDCPAAGTVEGDSGNAYVASSLNPTICIGEGSQGCVWKPGGTVPAVCANGKCYQWGPFTATGAACDPSSDVPGAPESAASAPVTDASCVAKGQCPGTINGTTTCVPCSSKSQESVTSTSTAASSAASGASPSTSTESGTTTTKTECSGSQCTTTTTTSTQKSDGSSEEKTSSKTEPQTDFCAANPKAAVCKGDDDSKWGGACTGGFTCSGDAVQCAQAQASYDLSCAMKTDPLGATVQAGNAAAVAGDRPPGHPADGVEMFNVQGSLDQTNVFGSSCPSDISLDLMGNSFSIPLSHACGFLRVMGYVAVAFSLLGAGRLVIGAV